MLISAAICARVDISTEPLEVLQELLDRVLRIVQLRAQRCRDLPTHPLDGVGIETGLVDGHRDQRERPSAVTGQGFQSSLQRVAVGGKRKLDGLLVQGFMDASELLCGSRGAGLPDCRQICFQLLEGFNEVVSGPNLKAC